MSPAVRVLLIVNVTVFLLRWVVNSRMNGAFDLIFGLSDLLYRDGFAWQIVTYMFLHGSGWHILLNMLILYMLGTEVERSLGTRNFLAVYFVSGILGGLGWLLLSDSGICIGASGAVYGLLGAYVALFPKRMITVLIFFVLPVTLRAWMLGAILAGIEFMMVTAGNPASRIAHSAHLAGLVAGYVFAFVVFREGGFKIRILPKEPRNRPGLKVLRREDASDVTSQEVDRILDKIAHEGMQSLSAKERAVLERASLSRRER